LKAKSKKHRDSRDSRDKSRKLGWELEAKSKRR
jgi:hypothetical protein